MTIIRRYNLNFHSSMETVSNCVIATALTVCSTRIAVFQNALYSNYAQMRSF